MKPILVKVIGLKKAYDLPNSWCDDDYRVLLQRLEIEDIDKLSSADLIDILLRALQDLGPEQAADAVLALKLGERITAGSRRNVVDDLLEGQRSWEEFADIRLHAPIFTAAVLLYRAFPAAFPRPDLMQLILRLQPRTPEAKEIFESPPEAAFVTRLLADAMDEHSILERLFDEQLRASAFPEAEGIVWLAHYDDEAETGDDSVQLTVYSSEHWLEDMESVDEFESAAYNDREPEDEDD